MAFDPYRQALGVADRRRRGWAAAAPLVAAKLALNPPLWRGEGDPATLEFEIDLGRLQALLRERRSYDRSFAAIEQAAWR